MIAQFAQSEHCWMLDFEPRGDKNPMCKKAEKTNAMHLNDSQHREKGAQSQIYQAPLT